LHETKNALTRESLTEKLPWRTGRMIPAPISECQREGLAQEDAKDLKKAGETVRRRRANDRINRARRAVINNELSRMKTTLASPRLNELSG
jgi:hypothetical protein